MVYVSYDVIVVGAGIAGLYTVRELLRSHPTWRIALIEKYKGLGGRTYSYKAPGFSNIQWEMGAGRIRKNHIMVMKLIKEYNLTFIPISENVSFLKGPDAPLENSIFESVCIPMYIAPLANLDKKVLATKTIQEIMLELYGREKTKDILERFPYKSEINTLRADLALQTFLGDGEMSSYKDYGVIGEGFSTLVACLRDECERRGYILLNRHTVTDIQSAEGNTTDVKIHFGKKGEIEGDIILRAEKACILALHRDALATIKPFHSWPLLRYIQTQPLLRCYAIFDRKNVWFRGLGKIVTPMRPRYILPIDEKKGVIMISYTDGTDAKEYIRIQKEGGDAALQNAVMKDIRSLFPEIYIPEPIFFRSHPWETGCSYWVPGLYEPKEISEKMRHPYPEKLGGVWLCGESWSLRQAWVEGALENAKSCLAELEKKIS
jgi:monoamine oxidase